MFGFLSAPCSGCSGQNHSIYQSHFCGLCNRLRQDYGLPMRFLVNRDATFLSLLGNALGERPAVPVRATCCNPLGKPRQLVQEGDAVSYAAAVTMCGLRAKLDDEVTDRRFRPARFAFRGVRGILSRPISRAEMFLNQHGFPVDAVRGNLSEQSSVEQQAVSRRDPDLDALSFPSAFAFGKIVAHSSEQARDALELMGNSLGRLIYTLDAFVDRKRDQKTGQFNPFLLQPGLVNILPDFMERDLSAISVHLGRLPLKCHREILDQILGRNLQRTCISILDGKAPAHQRNERRKKRNKSQNNNGCVCCDGWYACDCCDVIYCCDCPDSNSGCDGCSACDCGDVCCDCDVCCCDCG